MDQVMAMLNTMNNNINESKNDINNLKKDIKNEITNSTQAVNEKFETILDKFEIIQAENAATREELLARINTRSRVSTRAPSRAASPRQLAARLEELNMKMPELIPVTKMSEQTKDIKVPDLRMSMETPRAVYEEPRLIMT